MRCRPGDFGDRTEARRDSGCRPFAHSIAVAVGTAAGAVSAFRYDDVLGRGGLLSLAAGAGCGLASGILLVLLDRSRAKLEARKWYGEPESAKRAAIVEMYALYAITATVLIFIMLALMAIFIE